jgi:hypothetical protein
MTTGCTGGSWKTWGSPDQAREITDYFMEMTGLSSGHYIPRLSPEAPPDGIFMDCWDAKIFPENRQNKFLIRRRGVLRGRRNHPLFF